MKFCKEKEFKNETVNLKTGNVYQLKKDRFYGDKEGDIYICTDLWMINLKSGLSRGLKRYGDVWEDVTDKVCLNTEGLS